VTYTILFVAISQAISPVALDDDGSYTNIIDTEVSSRSASKPDDFDRHIRKLFRSMRFDFEVEIDYILLRILNKVFGLRDESAIFPNQLPNCNKDFYNK